MLVVDLQELLRPSTGDPRFITDFSERVTVDRDTNATNNTFILFSSSSGYDASIASIRDAGLVEPDALATLDGTELYQRHYRTPDPLWEKTVSQNWMPKPVIWVAEQFFGDDVDKVTEKEEIGVTVTCKKDARLSDVVDGVGKKLKEMGIPARVVAGADPHSIVIAPAAASAADVVTFCQMMLKVEENSTFVFGGDELISRIVRGKGNLGLVCSTSEHDWAAFDGRVFVSEDVGGKALLDGLMHYAVF